VKGDGVLTFAELKRFFRGDETLSEYFITNIDQYSEQRTKDKDTDSDDDPDLESSALAVPRGDGVITLAEWYAFFDFLLGKNKLEALRGLAKFERFMKTTELAAQTFMEGSKTGRPLVSTSCLLALFALHLLPTINNDLYCRRCSVKVRCGGASIRFLTPSMPRLSTTATEM